MKAIRACRINTEPVKHFCMLSLHQNQKTHGERKGIYAVDCYKVQCITLLTSTVPFTKRLFLSTICMPQTQFRIRHYLHSLTKYFLLMVCTEYSILLHMAEKKILVTLKLAAKMQGKGSIYAKVASACGSSSSELLLSVESPLLRTKPFLLGTCFANTSDQLLPALISSKIHTTWVMVSTVPW